MSQPRSRNVDLITSRMMDSNILSEVIYIYYICTSFIFVPLCCVTIHRELLPEILYWFNISQGKDVSVTVSTLPQIALEQASGVLLGREVEEETKNMLQQLLRIKGIWFVRETW